MRKNFNHDDLIKRSLNLAFKLDKLMNIAIRPKGYGQPLAGIMLDIMRYDDAKILQKILSECKIVEIDIHKHFKAQPSPSQMEFWYDVLTDWFTPLSKKEAFVIRNLYKKIPVKKICLEIEKEYGRYPNRKTIYNWHKQAIDKIKNHLWKKEVKTNYCRH